MLGLAPLALAQSPLPATSGTGFVSAPYTAAFAAAQTRDDLPSAPEPQRLAASDGGEQTQAVLPFTLPGAGLEFTASEIDSATEGGSGGAGPTAPPEAKTLTMFPHSDTAPYWVSGQANSIFQMHGHFHSPYEGANSLIDDFETKALKWRRFISAINGMPTRATTPTLSSTLKTRAGAASRRRWDWRAKQTWTWCATPT